MKQIKNMKTLKSFKFYFLLLFTAFTMTGCFSSSYYAETTPVRQDISYVNPKWAPEYYENVRYYYLPDIECYYDLSIGEFVYLRNGRWYNSRYFPSFYYDFNLDNCFVVILNSNVYKPWLHHQYYITHYPRYYYRDYYDYSNFPYVRGFNENQKSAIYWGEKERYKARDWDDRNIRRNKDFKYSEKDRQYQRNIINSGYGKKYNEDARPDVDGSKEVITPDRNGVSNRDERKDQGRQEGTSSVRSNNQTQTRSESTTRNQSSTPSRSDANQRSAQTSGQTRNESTTQRGTDAANQSRTESTTQRGTDAANQSRTESTTQRGTDAAGQTRSASSNSVNTESDRRSSDAANQTRSGGGTVARTRTTQTRSDSIQGANYYGKTIGNPVRVNKQMQDDSKSEKAATRTGSGSSGRRR
jgi:hypothetical protein